MNIAIYDPDTADRRPWNDFIGAGHTVTNLQNLALQDGNVCLLFVHGSYLSQGSFNTFRTASPKIPVAVISGGPPPVWWNDNDCSYWRKAIVDKPGLHFSICCQRFLRRLTEDRVLEFVLLEPSGEVELAFRLLCEAKQACGDDAKKENYNGTGITIHSPQSIWQWLEPFGITKPQGAPAKVDAETIERVAAMMGSEFKDKAKAVLDAVNHGNDLSTPVRNFLGEPEATTASS